MWKSVVTEESTNPRGKLSQLLPVVSVPGGGSFPSWEGKRSARLLRASNGSFFAFSWENCFRLPIFKMKFMVSERLLPSAMFFGDIYGPSTGQEEAC